MQRGGENPHDHNMGEGEGNRSTVYSYTGETQKNGLGGKGAQPVIGVSNNTSAPSTPVVAWGN